MRLAWFVSPHGFGHAARSAAVLAALRELDPTLEVTLYTTVPRWFFEESLGFPFEYREVACDVGLVQRSAVEEDLGATVERLEALFRAASEGEVRSNGEGEESETESEGKGFLRRERQRVEELLGLRVNAVVCDIAPLGLKLAREAEIPSVLLESFTWDWIYEPLVEREPRLGPWVERLQALFGLADFRIRAEPVCGEPSRPASFVARGTPEPVSLFPSMESLSVSSLRSATSLSISSLSASVSEPSSSIGNRSRTERLAFVPPIARRPRSTPAEVRSRLGLLPAAAGRPLILVSMGGVPWSFENLERWSGAKELDFVVPGGASGSSPERRENLVLLPHHSPVYHPDLVAAADVIVGKLGYSTVAEAVGAGTRYLFLPRTGFREHPVLARFVAGRVPAREISLAEFESGAWVRALPALLGEPLRSAVESNGAAVAARAILEFVASLS